MGLWREYTHINASMRVLRLFTLTLTSGPWLDAIIGGGGGGIHIFMLKYRKNNRFQKKSVGQNTNIWICLASFQNAGTGVECRDSKHESHEYVARVIRNSKTKRV